MSHRCPSKASSAGQLLISWAVTIAAVYAILLATYVVTCLVVTQLNRRIAGAKLETIPGAGHLANLEQPEAFTDAVRRFLRVI